MVVAARKAHDHHEPFWDRAARVRSDPRPAIGRPPGAGAVGVELPGYVPNVQTYVVLRTPTGAFVELVPGDLVGRAAGAALQLDDGRVSEAHAMISLREGQLQLLPLRGALALGGEPVSHVVLRAGVVIDLALGVHVTVTEVHLPDEVLGIEGDTLPRQMLPSVASILDDGRLRIVTGWREDAAAHLWITGDEFHVRVGADTQSVTFGDTLTFGSRKLSFIAIPLGEAGPRTTRRLGDFGEPLHLVSRFDTVQIHRDGRAPVIFSGMQARCLSELVSIDGPVAWTVLTAELWPNEDDASVRRGRLDALLLRIRRRLRAVGLRTDLVRTDGAGTLEIVRYPNDRIEDLS